MKDVEAIANYADTTSPGIDLEWLLANLDTYIDERVRLALEADTQNERA